MEKQSDKTSENLGSVVVSYLASDVDQLIIARGRASSVVQRSLVLEYIMENSFVAKSLGYDARIAGITLDNYLGSATFSLNSRVIDTSYDINVCPQFFSVGGEKEYPFQEEIDLLSKSDTYFELFGAFRSDRDIISIFANPKSDVSIYVYRAFFSELPKDEVLDSWIQAMSHESVAPPSLEYEFCGYDVIDENFTSVVHCYEGFDLLPVEIVPANLPAIQEKYRNPSLFMVEIQRAIKNYWLR